MRTLTRVTSADNFVTGIELKVTAFDAFTDEGTGQSVGSVFTFTNADILNITKVIWETPFGGGLGKTAFYGANLAPGLDWIKLNLKKLVRAEVELKVICNSEVFYPHVGRVRKIARDARNPHTLRLEIYDKFLDSVPKVPSAAIVDSYSNSHPEVINNDIGYPLYYGYHHRPFYHVPVDCSISSLLGPRNVSTTNHVNSVWFVMDSQYGATTELNRSFLMNKTWAQQSGSTNLVSGGYPFEVMDNATIGLRSWKWDGVPDNKSFHSFSVQSEGSVSDFNGGYIDAISTLNDGGANIPFQARLDIEISSRLTNESFNTTRINGSVDFTNVTSIDVRSGSGGSLADGLNFRASILGGDLPALGKVNLFTSVATVTHVFSVDIASGSARGFLSSESSKVFANFNLDLPDNGTSVTGEIHCVSSLQFGHQMKSESYFKYSIFSPVVNSGDIAISANPYGIINDLITTQTSYTLVSLQNSNAQVDTSSYTFNCNFTERRYMTEILHDFGETTATYLWIGDSGALNFRTYQESAAGIEDSVITTSDMIDFDIVENPLGVSQYKSLRAKRIRVDYDFDFTQGRYRKTLQADPSNNVFCNSVAVAGVDRELIRQSKYILDTDTASYFLGNLTRFYTQDERIITMNLPARFYNLEISDVIKVQHPMIVGSESLFQITRVSADYMKGIVDIQAQELTDLQD